MSVVRCASAGLCDHPVRDPNWVVCASTAREDTEHSLTCRIAVVDRAYDATALAAIVSAHRMSGSVLVVTGLATLFAADERAPHARRRCIIVQASRPVVGVPDGRRYSQTRRGLPLDNRTPSRLRYQCRSAKVISSRVTATIALHGTVVMVRSRIASRIVSRHPALAASISASHRVRPRGPGFRRSATGAS
jgi:hypothetical protein